MANLHELSDPIPQNMIESLRDALTNIQGNILGGHGRDRSVLICLQFKAEDQEESRQEMVKKVKKWIHNLAPRVTSAQRQLDDATDYTQYDIPGSLFISFFLSAKGYEYLGCDLPGDSEAFREGMKERGKVLHDPPMNTWEEGYQQRIDAMVLLADNDENLLLRKACQILDTVKPIANVCIIEHGRTLRNEHGENIEHFGYVDGRSQPLFFAEGVKREKGENDGTSVWNPAAGPNLVVVQECNRGEAEAGYGSYLVFRKLEQNVRAFKEKEKELAETLGLTGENEERAGALAIGRFEDGTPVVLHKTEGLHAPISNNFTYADDPDGLKCPLHAHIRKVNPRGELVGENERVHRVARRGIPYGKRKKEPKDEPSIEELPTEGVGLLFMCYQKDIANQFEYLQTQFANKPHCLKPRTEIDPIIGQPQKGVDVSQQWPLAWGTSREQRKFEPFAFHGFVTLKGGEYFFAPSISFLKAI
jgi:Dyp-type peroxidase family